MRARLTLVLDLLMLTIATAVAQLLRDNLVWSAAKFEAAVPYFIATGLVAVVILPFSGLARSIWRFSSLPDYQRIVVVVSAIVLGALALTFSFNRLDGVSRTLPILQTLLGITFMVGARVLFRMRQAHRQARKSVAVAPLTRVDRQQVRSILIVGLNRLTETYLQSLVEFEPGRVKVVGILGQADRHVGRLAGAQKVLGVPEDLPVILRDLKVHGVAVDRIVVTTRLEAMSEDARAGLLAIEETGEVELQFLAEILGFENFTAPGRRDEVASDTVAPSSSVTFNIPAADLAVIGRRHYWKVKRFGDAIAAGALILLLLPVMFVLAIAISFGIGVPVTFWQQRPGLGGVPFRLYKFRTMSAAHDSSGRRRSDAERTTWLGDFLRRTRLDELPQLFNIVRGEMSFIGPRPLLPRDQAESHSARLLVRPGLTGWAQVVGGRIISADDKAALDIWYVQNASFSLDVYIVARTIRMILLGEQVSENLVRIAWRDLGKAGFLVREADRDAEFRQARSAA